MDTNLTNYGWSGSADCSIDINNNLIFNAEGYAYNLNTNETSEKIIEVNSSFSFNNIDFGIVLWYNNEIGMLSFSTNGITAKFEKSLRNNNIILKSVYLENVGITEPVEGEIINLRAVINGQHILCYYNDILILEIEDNTFNEGYFGIYGKQNAKCTGFSLSTNKIDNWNIYKENGTSISKKGNDVQFVLPEILTPGYSYIYQDAETLYDGDYTISFNYTGNIRVDLYDGTTLISSSSFTSEENAREEMLVSILGTRILTIRIGSETPGTHFISLPQLENKSYKTSYTEISRDNSKLTFPAKELNVEHGTLGLWISPKHSYSSSVLPVFYYNDTFKLSYSDGIFTLTYGLSTVSILYPMQKDKWYYITCLWSNDEMIVLDVYDMELDKHGPTGGAPIEAQDIPLQDYIYIGSTPEETGDIAIDNLIIYKVKASSLQTFLTENMYNEDVSNSQIVVKANFRNGSLKYDNNRISVPIPRVDSPVIVKSSSGQVYDRVYFVEDDKYVLRNKERFMYKGNNSFKLLYETNSFIRLEAYEELEDRKVQYEYSKSGYDITVNGLTEEDIGKEIIVEYIIKNTYCINYGSAYSQYEIQLSNSHGEDIEIEYQDDYGTETKLLRTVELNPFKSTNNSGFIYIEDKPRKLEAFDIKVTPDSLVADGFDVATIVIDCLSEDGIPTSNVDLKISGELYGKISKYISPEEQEWIDYKNTNGEEAAIERFGDFISDEHRTGRFIYKYKATKLLPIKDSLATAASAGQNHVIVSDIKAWNDKISASIDGRKFNILSIDESTSKIEFFSCLDKDYEAGTRIDADYEVIDNITIKDSVSGIAVQIPIRLVRES